MPTLPPALIAVAIISFVLIVWAAFGIQRETEWKRQYLEDQAKDIERGLREEGYIK